MVKLFVEGKLVYGENLSSVKINLPDEVLLIEIIIPYCLVCIAEIQKINFVTYESQVLVYIIRIKESPKN